MDTIPGSVVVAANLPKVTIARSRLHERKLAQGIRQRIVRQTGRRICDLSVSVESGVVIIQGRCWTFYTKQLAQHAAMALIEDEQVCNNIDVIAP